MVGVKCRAGGIASDSIIPASYIVHTYVGPREERTLIVEVPDVEFLLPSPDKESQVKEQGSFYVAFSNPAEALMWTPLTSRIPDRLALRDSGGPRIRRPGDVRGCNVVSCQLRFSSIPKSTNYTVCCDSAKGDITVQVVQSTWLRTQMTSSTLTM